MDMRDTMSGMDQLYNAMLQQALDAPPIQVDEMQQGRQAQSDQMKEIAGLGQNTAAMGIPAMMAALEAAGTKKKDMPNVYAPSSEPSPFG
jgi:hypothetical protein